MPQPRVRCPRSGEPGAACAGKLFYPRNLGLHQRVVHAEPATDASAAVGLGARPSAPANRASAPERTPVRPDGGEGCTMCDANRRRAEDRDQLAAELEALKARQAAAGPSVPSLAAVIDHCESGECQTHTGELAALKERVISATLADREAVTAAGHALGLIPKAIKVEFVPAGARG